jgi:hypothetical protein
MSTNCGILTIGGGRAVERFERPGGQVDHRQRRVHAQLREKTTAQAHQPLIEFGFIEAFAPPHASKSYELAPA